jgi:hypothetical protein
MEAPFEAAAGVILKQRALYQRNGDVSADCKDDLTPTRTKERRNILSASNHAFECKIETETA